MTDSSTLNVWLHFDSETPLYSIVGPKSIFCFYQCKESWIYNSNNGQKIKKYSEHLLKQLQYKSTLLQVKV